MIALLAAASMFVAHEVRPGPAERVAFIGNQVVTLPPNAYGAVLVDGQLAIAMHEEKVLRLGERRISADVEPHTHWVAAADFDGDGAQDLVVNDMARRRALILFGPKFEQTLGVPSGSKGYAYLNAAAADFDGDGKPDLAIADWPQSEVSVVLNRGQRKFGDAKVIALPNPAFFVLAADLDGDGHADLAVAMFGGSISDKSRDGLAILRGDGKGNFAAPQTLESGPAPTMLAYWNGVLAICDQGGKQVTIYKNHLSEKELVRTDGTPTGIALGAPGLAVASDKGVEIFLTKAK